MNTTAPFPNVQETNQTAWSDSGSSEGLPVGVGNTLCNNEAGVPCGASQSNAQVPPSFIRTSFCILLKASLHKVFYHLLQELELARSAIYLAVLPILHHIYARLSHHL